MTCPERIEIGADVQIGAGSWLSVVDEHLGRRYSPRLVIGDGVSLGPGIVIACMGSVEIGDRVLTASRVFIGDTYHEYRGPNTAVIDQPMAEPDPVQIGAGAFLGIASIILPGVTVGERAYVAAGAVVTADVPSCTLVAGNPARIIKRWDAGRQSWIGVSASERDPAIIGPGDVGTGAGAGVRTGHEAQTDEGIAALEHRAAVAEAELAACEAEVKALQLQRDTLLALVAEAEKRHAASEFWLDEHRRSLSWRVTGPARDAKRRWLEISRRAPR